MANHLPSSHSEPIPLYGSVPNTPPVFLERVADRHRLAVDAGAIYDVLDPQRPDLFIEWFHHCAVPGGYKYGEDYWFRILPSGDTLHIWTSLDMAMAITALSQTQSEPTADELYQHFRALRAQLTQDLCGSYETDNHITTSQAQSLKDMARVEAQRTGDHPQTVWTAFQHHFEINSYLNLPANRFEDACAYFNARKNQLSHTAAPSQPSTEFQPGDYLQNLHYLCELKGLQKEADCITQTAFNGLKNLLGLS